MADSWNTRKKIFNTQPDWLKHNSK